MSVNISEPNILTEFEGTACGDIRQTDPQTIKFLNGLS